MFTKIWFSPLSSCLKPDKSRFRNHHLAYLYEILNLSSFTDNWNTAGLIISLPSSVMNAEYNRPPRRISAFSDFHYIKSAFIVHKNILILWKKQPFHLKICQCQWILRLFQRYFKAFWDDLLFCRDVHDKICFALTRFYLFMTDF